MIFPEDPLIDLQEILQCVPKSDRTEALTALYRFVVSQIHPKLISKGLLRQPGGDSGRLKVFSQISHTPLEILRGV